MKRTGAILSGLLAIAVAACAEAPASQDYSARAREATAAAIGGGLAPDAVTVTGVTRTMVKSEWRASTPGGNYACDADERFTAPACRPLTD